MDSGAWWATDQRVTKSQTQLKRLSKHVNTAKYVYLVPLLVFRIYLPDTSSTTLYSSHYPFCITSFLFICFWLCWVFVAAARAFTLLTVRITGNYRQGCKWKAQMCESASTILTSRALFSIKQLIAHSAGERTEVSMKVWMSFCTHMGQWGKKMQDWEGRNLITM